MCRCRHGAQVEPDQDENGYDPNSVLLDQIVGPNDSDWQQLIRLGEYMRDFDDNRRIKLRDELRQHLASLKEDV